MKTCDEISALEEPERTAQHHRTLLEINNAIITSLTQEALLHALSEALRRVISLDRAAITIYDPRREKFRFLAIEGPPSDFFRVGLEVGRHESVCCQAFDEQRSIVRYDLEREQRFPVDRYFLAEGVRSDCFVPLMVGGKAIGTLAISSEKPNQFSETDAEFLREVAKQIALAVANMTSYEEITALNLQVERTAARYRTLLEINNAIITHLTQEDLLRSVFATLRTIIPFDRAAFTLYNPANETFRYLAMDGTLPSPFFRQGVEFHRSASISARVFDEQRPVLRRDLEREQEYPNDRRLVAEGIKADCLVPLIVAGRSLGTLNVASLTRNQYSEDDMQLLQDIGNQVALAVANMQAYEEIAALKARLEKENVYLQEEIRTEHNFEEIVGNSPALLTVLRKLEQVAATGSTVLIRGETGTGKELVARAIHGRSPRKHRPLVKVNCSAISAGLVESELFGHDEGRVHRRHRAPHRSLRARGRGHDLPRRSRRAAVGDAGQAAAGASGTRVRARREQPVDAGGRPCHRGDQPRPRGGGSFGRLSLRPLLSAQCLPIGLPSLRERRADIPQLAAVFLAHYATQLGKSMEGIAIEAMERLASYPWPGNVRELQNVIERAVILARGPILELEPDLVSMLTPSVLSAMPNGASEEVTPTSQSAAVATLAEVEREYILRTLGQTNGIVEGPKGAARLLNLHPNTLRHRMAKLGIRRSAASHPS